MLSQITPFPGRHQRQNSTPTKLDASKTFSPAGHRRGLSSDQLGYAHQSHGPLQQDCNPPSIEYTLGQQLNSTAPMREAQQQLMARPGLYEPLAYETFNDAQYLKAMPRLAHGTKTFTNNNPITPITETDGQTQQSLQGAHKINNMEILQFDRTTSAGNLDGFGDGLDEETGNIQTNQITTEEVAHPGMQPTSGSRPTSKEGIQHPCTPPAQMRTSYFPLTPATTPYSQNAIFKKTPPIRNAESSPTREDPNLTIKACHAMQRGTSCQDNFAAMKQHVMSSDIPSPPHTSLLEIPHVIDLADFPQPSFPNMSSLGMEMPPWEGGYNVSNYSPMSNAVSSAYSSFHSSPETTHMSLFGENIGNDLLGSDSSSLPSSQGTMDFGSFSLPDKQDPQARSQSVSQVDDLDDCIEDTGVTCDEIAAFISMPPGDDNRYECLYPKCGKKFARRENIKSHVQTHLGDRQFRCRDCEKRFVRQHDLKRHANIHSGVRQYPCPCGKPFARHDALTRHRQRGMCIGAFEGTPKKAIKRGRPKKTRPETEDRLEKSAATRQRALEKLEKRSPGTYASSISDSSTSAYPSPEQFDSPLEQAGSPPGLDISSASSTAPPAADLATNPSHSYPVSFESSIDPFGMDFDLSASIARNEACREMPDSFFDEYLNTEDGGEIVPGVEFESGFLQ